MAILRPIHSVSGKRPATGCMSTTMLGRKRRGSGSPSGCCAFSSASEARRQQMDRRLLVARREKRLVTGRPGVLERPDRRPGSRERRSPRGRPLRRARPAIRHLDILTSSLPWSTSRAAMLGTPCHLLLASGLAISPVAASTRPKRRSPSAPSVPTVSSGRLSPPSELAG